jgi:tetratricopeptide (TPR) repeat protein
MNERRMSARSETLGLPWRLRGSGGKSHYAVVLAIAFAAVVPSAIWIGLDKTAWPWDEAWYGKHSVELFFTLLYSPSRWPAAMLNVLGMQAPGIVWFGQFFVPVGLTIGSIDIGLLLSVILAQLSSMLLASLAVWELSGRRLGPAVVAVAAMGSAPLFVGLSHYFVVEMFQTAAVAWFVLIMAMAPRWSRWVTAGHLLMATSFAMLAKISSPVYCFGPGLVAVYYIVRPAQNHDVRSRGVVAVRLAFGGVLATATAAWYYRNLHIVLDHVSTATTGTVAELYGMKANFLQNLGYWLSAFHFDFFSPITAIIGAAILVASLVVSVVTRQAGSGRLALAAAVAALQVAAVFTIFSLSSAREDRYLLPALPYAVLMICWSVNRLDRRWLTSVMTAAFALQWGYVHAQGFGLSNRVSRHADWINVAATDPANRMLLRSLVEKTCADRTPEFYWNTAGVQLLWLNPPAISFAAAKALAPRRALNCDFDAIGYYDNDEDKAWANLMSKQVAYYIAVDPAVHQVPPRPVDLALNQMNAGLLKRIQSSGLFQREPGIDGYPGILIFKRVSPIASVAAGRALSDEGRHQAAIDELTRASVQDPTSVEAWANLALAYERAGNYLDAVAAGNRALTLNAGHYYVNLGLARALMELKDWAGARRRAEEASVNAPGNAERIAALTIAAQASFQARDSRRGCEHLRSAAKLQPGHEVSGELARNGCGE